MKRRGTPDTGLGHRIRARRKSIGMTQAALATAIGVSFQQVQKYEKGLSAVSRNRLHQICDTLRLPLEFFGGETTSVIARGAPAGDTGDGADGAARFLATGEGQRLVQSFMAIADPRLRTRILDFIASVATDQPPP